MAILAVSHFNPYLLGPILKGETGKFVVPFDKFKHSITYDEDFAKCLAIVGNSKNAQRAVGIVPNNPAMTFLEYATIIAKVVKEDGGSEPAKVVASKLMPDFIQFMWCSGLYISPGACRYF